jgi:hypothetical protein
MPPGVLHRDTAAGTAVAQKLEQRPVNAARVQYVAVTKPIWDEQKLQQ